MLPKHKNFGIILAAFFMFSFVFVEMVSATAIYVPDELPEIHSIESSIQGRIEGTGTYFEIKDSEYLNISLQSSEEINVVLESIPSMITLNTKTSSFVSSSSLTFEGLETNKTYYKFEDSYKNGVVFGSDENGRYTWTQDLTQPHHIWIQEEKGTVFLPEYCSSYGVWDETTSTCTLTQDITDNVEITADYITLDCGNYGIRGPTGYGADKSGYGIYLNSRKGVVINNCIVRGFHTSVYLERSSFNTFTKNSISKSWSTGVQLYYSNDNTIKYNTFEKCGSRGIYVRYSQRNNLTSNAVFNGGDGVRLSGSNGNILSDNILLDNGNGLVVGSSSYNTIINNTANRSIYGNGIAFINANYNNLIHNTASGNVGSGIMLEKSSNNIIAENIIVDNRCSGINLYKYSNYNTLVNNTIQQNHRYGVKVNSKVYSSSGNNIFHNNFKDNHYKPQAYIGKEGINNLFYNDYPLGGNYWSDYTGEDLYSGASQVQSGSDGIGDTSYTFSGGQDRYPFMEENGWEVKETSDFWVNVSKDESCIYDNDSIGNIDLNRKLKCLPTGWILKKELDENGNPIARAMDVPGQGIKWFNNVTDVTDGVSGWMDEDDFEYDKTKQDEWKNETKEVISVKYDFPSVNFRFEDNLKQGDRGSEVAYLQIILKEEYCFPEDTQITGYFGPITTSSVICFQNKYLITEDSGFVGEFTIVELNDLLDDGLDEDIDKNYSRKSRFSAISDVAEQFRTKYLAEFPISLILAVIANEMTSDADNEFISFDCGRGISQITSNSLVGKRSGVKCYCGTDKAYMPYEFTGKWINKILVFPPAPNNGWTDRECITGSYKGETAYRNCSCKGNEECEVEKEWYYGGTDTSGRCRYYNSYDCGCKVYTNTLQGIEASIKDKQGKLRETYYNDDSNYRNCKSDETGYNDCIMNCGNDEECKKRCEENLGDWSKCLKYSVDCDTMRLISAVQRYNTGSGFTTYLAKYDEDDNLINGIAYWLRHLQEKFNYDNDLTLAEDVERIYENRGELNIFSPGDIQVYDSKGRVTGLINGTVKEEIPNSIYDNESKTVVIFFPFDTYRYEVEGTDTGTYGLEITSAEDGESMTFTLTTVSTTNQTTHQYTINWQDFNTSAALPVTKLTYENSTLTEVCYMGNDEENITGAPIIWNLSVTNTSSDIPFNIIFTYNDTIVSRYASDGAMQEEFIDALKYNISLSSINDDIIINLDNINLTHTNNKTIGLDKLKNQTEIIYAINLNISEWNQTNVTINLSYDELSIGHITLYKCDNWNFTERNCTDESWTELTYDEQNGFLVLNVSNFSGFKIEQEPFCGDNICNNEETCSTCQQDCGQCIDTTVYGTVVDSTGDFAGEAEVTVTCSPGTGYERVEVTMTDEYGAYMVDMTAECADGSALLVSAQKGDESGQISGVFSCYGGNEYSITLTEDDAEIPEFPSLIFAMIFPLLVFASFRSHFNMNYAS